MSDKAVDQLQARVAIGRRAVGLLRDLEWSRPVIDAHGFSGRGCLKCLSSMAAGHVSHCELAAILRDAEQANGQGILDSSAPEPATVAVDARAMAELLEQAAEDIQVWGAYASAYFQEKHNLAANVAKYLEAAYRLLAEGGVNGSLD